MEYITRAPRALNATESRLLAIITAERWWLPDYKCFSYDDQEALHFLWKNGYVEQAAYGGWKVKGQGAQPPAARLAVILHTHGITPLCEPVVTTSIYAVPGRDNFFFRLARGQVLGAAVGAFERVWRSGDSYVVTMKGE